jgi:hypothetical protein
MSVYPVLYTESDGYASFSIALGSGGIMRNHFFVFYNSQQLTMRNTPGGMRNGQSKQKKLKRSLQQAVEVHRVVKRRGSHIFSRQSAHR